LGYDELIVTDPASVLPTVAVELLRAVVDADSHPDLPDNVDAVRWPDGQPATTTEAALWRLGELLRHAPALQATFELLDPEDRELMVRVLTYRVLGHRKVRLPASRDRHREQIARAATTKTAARTASLGVHDLMADDFDLRPLGFPVRLRASIGTVVHIFQIEQYCCPGAPAIGPRTGDAVIDGGAYWGDTALYFAHRVGRRGRVVGFEFEPGNLEMLRYNLGLNPGLARRIEIVSRALWERPGAEISFRTMGPGTTVDAEGDAVAVTDTIDHLVERGGVDRVDFIKLDIEGSELSALRGAERTLRRFRPRLAVSAYHRDDDLALLPAYLTSLDLGYRLRLRHETMHAEETVLFAAVPGADGSPRSGRFGWRRARKGLAALR
jgi:FkbM family methyltransferase